MTRRDRLEAKLAKRQEWAEGRRDKAAVLEKRNEPYRGDWAFITQPGHIPERERVNRRDEKRFEHLDMAAHHESKAAGLASQLDRSVFSDDADATQQLEARIAERVAELERRKAINKEIRKGPGWEARIVPPLTEGEKGELLTLARIWGSAYKPGFPPYSLTNLSASIRRDRERIEEVKRRQARTERAEAAGGVVIEGAEWVRVTFAEKPDRAVLDALKAAGFRWGGGSWVGERAKLPECVKGGVA